MRRSGKGKVRTPPSLNPRDLLGREIKLASGNVLHFADRRGPFRCRQRHFLLARGPARTPTPLGTSE